MILEIVKKPNPILYQKAEPIYLIDDYIKTLSSYMIETMNYYNGIGIAANQVGVLKAMFIFTWNKKPVVAINPEIESKNVVINSLESCLSIDNYVSNVKRYKYIKVRYTDINGRPVNRFLSDMSAICFQHELDHLNGILI